MVDTLHGMKLRVHLIDIGWKLGCSVPCSDQPAWMEWTVSISKQHVVDLKHMIDAFHVAPMMYWCHMFFCLIRINMIEMCWYEARAEIPVPRKMSGFLRCRIRLSFALHVAMQHDMPCCCAVILQASRPLWKSKFRSFRWKVQVFRRLTSRTHPESTQYAYHIFHPPQSLISWSSI